MAASDDLKDDTNLLAVADEEEEEEEAKGTSVFDAFGQWAMFGLVSIVFTSLCAAGAAVSWHLGITFCFFFLMFAFALAVNIEHAKIWQEISRPLWVLVCLLLGCFFTWLSICVVGDWDGPEQTLRKDQNKVQSIFEWPDELKSWVADESTESGISHIDFDGFLFFGGSTGDRRLVRTMSPTNATRETVEPGMADAHSFIKFNSDLYFFARKSVNDHNEHLWSIRGAQPNGTAVVVKAFTNQEIPRSPVLWNNQLFFKVYVRCGSFKTWSHYVSDGTTQGTMDENSGKLYADLLKACASVSSGTEMKPPRSRLYGVLFLAVIPSTSLALVLLYVLQTSGVVLNILGGIYAFVMLCYLLIVDDLAHMKNVFEVSALVYAICGYGLFGIMKLRAVNLPEWMAALTDWALIGMSVAFFGAINLVLEIPNSTDGWNWAVYVIVQLMLAMLGLLVKLALPVVFAGIGFMVVACKGGFEGVEGADSGLGPDMKLTVQLSVTFVLGLLVVGAGALYVFYRAHLEAYLAALIFRTEQDEQLEGQPQQPEDGGKKEAWSGKAQKGSSSVPKLDAAAESPQSPRDAPDVSLLPSSGVQGPAASKDLDATPPEASPASLKGPSAEDVDAVKQLQQLKFHDLVKLQNSLLSSSKGFTKKEDNDDSTVGLHTPAGDVTLETLYDKTGDTSEDEC